MSEARPTPYALQGETEFAPDIAALLRPLESTRIEEYGRFQQHLVLMEDVGRIDAFVRAIDRCDGGSVVLDVGAGTGVLGILALKRGFEHAVLIEPSRKMGLYARHLARLNGVEDRVTIIESTAEAVEPSVLPAAIDLIVTETLSSLLFGFGCWDVLPTFVSKLTPRGNVIPVKGTVYALACAEDLATRGPAIDGLRALRDAGVRIDLYERTFRSGGNIYDKKLFLEALVRDRRRPSRIASFDFTRQPVVDLSGGVLETRGLSRVSGIVTYWSVSLTTGELPVQMSSLDPRVTSWYPYFIPFSLPLPIGDDEPLPIRIELVPVDAPYTYAFRFLSDDRELTHVLYW